jgi:hypothetical protein
LPAILRGRPPGHAALGRGRAALPAPLLGSAGLASALSALAEDAVKVGRRHGGEELT